LDISEHPAKEQRKRSLKNLKRRAKKARFRQKRGSWYEGLKGEGSAIRNHIRGKFTEVGRNVKDSTTKESVNIECILNKEWGTFWHQAMTQIATTKEKKKEMAVGKHA